MLSKRIDPLPIVAVRDTLGLVRACYRAELAGDRAHVRLERLAEAGKLLQRALDLAAEHPAGTVGHFAAWAAATEGLRIFAAQVEVFDRAEPIVRAAQRAVSERRRRR